VVGSIALAQDGVGQGAGTGEGQANPEGITAPTPVPGGPGFVSLSVFGFTPYLQTNSFAYSNHILWNTGATGAYFECPLSLPQGATITKLGVYYYDFDPATSLDVELLRGPLDTYSGNPFAEVISVDAGTSIGHAETTSIDMPVIDNQVNAYWVQVYLPPTHNVALNGVRVDYSYPSMLPMIQK
jgi:hypothetical protein